MLDQTEGYVTEDGRQIGGVVMEMKNITLRFGGVVAIKDISFDIREGEIRAIIGPNGAGKSSMLNVISGFYIPQEGEVWFRGSKRPPTRPYQVAQQGIARTFQNIALFEGMSVLDNVMTGRLTQMRSSIFHQALWRGKAEHDRAPVTVAAGTIAGAATGLGAPADAACGTAGAGGVLRVAHAASLRTKAPGSVEKPTPRGWEDVGVAAQPTKRVSTAMGPAALICFASLSVSFLSLRKAYHHLSGLATKPAARSSA